MKTKKNNFRLLTISVFFHLFSCVCACYLDMQTRPDGHLNEVNYGGSFFSGWSVQASLITVIYFIYKLFKKSPSNYFDKVFDLIVINANIISISLFTIAISPISWGGKPCTAAPSKGGPITIFFFEMDRKVFGGFYTLIWHYLTPILTIAYFVRRKTSLARTYFERRQLFFYSFLHPFFYVAFVLFRPLISGSEKYFFGKTEHRELKKYPYFFFDGTRHGKYDTLLGILLVIFIIFLGLILFGFSTLFFWRYAKHKLETKRKNNLEKNKIFSQASQEKSRKNK